VYKWARGLVKEREFTVSAGDIERFRGAHGRLGEVAEEVRRELNAVLALYALHSRDLYEKLRPHLEVDLGMADELAEARSIELSKYSEVNMGTKAYAALLSVARGGIYGHAAMLLMAEGALADMVLLTPMGAYEKAGKIAGGRGEAVDPSYSGRRGRSVGQPSWEDRATSVLLRFLIGYGEADLKFRHVEKEGKKYDEKGRVVRGFQVFRAYGGVEAFVGELWIRESTARFKVSKEELRRFVEEAKRTAPDLSGVKKMWQTLEWFATDVSFDRGWIEGATTDTRQAAWYIALFGEPNSISGRADVTEEGIKPNVTMRWRREVLDRIIAEEGEELKPLLGRAVKSWRELVDAIDWSWVLERVEELADELKPWIGRKEASDAEREDLMRRMLSELALFVHFAETRRGKNDREWREERVKRLAKAVETFSGGRIAGDHADRLARAIIRYTERHKKEAGEDIDKLAEELARILREDVEKVREEVWVVVKRFLSGEDRYVYCLARDCTDDRIVRKFVAPALELIMLDKALRGEFDRERAKLLFGEMYATALAGDGHVESGEVELAVGGELGGDAALLRLTTLHLLSQLLPKELKFNARVYVERSIYRITARGEDARRFMRFLAMTVPSAGGEYLSNKFNEFVKETRVEVQLDKNSIRLTKKGRVAADLVISEAVVAVKYNVYLRRDNILLQFRSADRSRAELAARLLRLAGVSAEIGKVDGGDSWYVVATTDKLAAGREELRNAIAEIVRRAVENGWVDANKAERWLKKLEEGLTLMEGWPKYKVRLVKGALEIRFGSTDPDSIAREVQRLRDMGLEEGRHFTVKIEDSGKGYVYILREGLKHAAWLSVHASEDQRKLVADFVKYILQRAEEKGENVRKKVEKIVEEGMSRGSLKLEGFEKEVEVEGRKYVVKVIDGGAEFEKSESGKLLLRIRITAEVDGVRSDYTITFGRYGKNKALGFATARADPDGREADAERFSALIKALTGKEPKIRRMKNGSIIIECSRAHLEGFKRYAELADVIEKWLEETGR
jgi:hypothetical protein